MPQYSLKVYLATLTRVDKKIAILLDRPQKKMLKLDSYW